MVTINTDMDYGYIVSNRDILVSYLTNSVISYC